MSPRILIIDDAADFRLLVRHYLAIEWTGARVDEWDPIERGRPPADFPWAGYDAVLLDYELGEETGLDWLRVLRRLPDLPPVVFLTGAGSEEVAVRAMKLGAADYLRKHDLSKARLVEALRTVIAERAAVDSEETLRADELDAAVATFAEDPSENGPRIDGYRYRGRIGRGGMSTVYLVERVRDGLPIVLKVLHGEMRGNSQLLGRFVREYGIVSKLESPYVARIHDQGFTDDHVYIAMEYFEGDDLKCYMAEGLAPRQCLGVLYQIGRALQVIHGAGIIHRDLKPQNVLFRADGSLALVDFGVSKMLVDDTPITRHGEVFGTPLYMSPEHGSGTHTDARSDLYSLGAIFHEMLSGQKLFTADSPLALLYKHLHQAAPRLPEHLADYQELADLLLAKKPESRFQTAAELLDYVTRRFGEPEPYPVRVRVRELPDAAEPPAA